MNKKIPDDLLTLLKRRQTLSGDERKEMFNEYRKFDEFYKGGLVLKLDAYEAGWIQANKYHSMKSNFVQSVEAPDGLHQCALNIDREDGLGVSMHVHGGQTHIMIDGNKEAMQRLAIRFKSWAKAVDEHLEEF